MTSRAGRPVAIDAAELVVPPAMARLGRIGLGVGVVAALACAVGAAVDPAGFARAWLVACFDWLAIALGCLALTMIQHMSGGRWGLVARRLLEAAAGTLPLLAVLMLPLLARLGDLYSWAAPGAVDDPLLAHKAAYLNPSAFVLRFVLYFVIWVGLALVLARMSRAQDETGDPDLNRRMRIVSGPGLVLWAFTVTFAAFDWLMSLQPAWFSTIYGVYFFGGFGLSAMAFLVLAARLVADTGPAGPANLMARALGPERFHDWGKLTLAFLLLWTYFAVSQFLIIWAGNLPEEIEWYLHRLQHGWQWLALALVLFHFAVPFALLLSRDLKRDPRRLAWLAVGLLFIRWVDVYWQVAPVFHPEGFTLGWLDLAAPLAVGGLWLAAFVWLLGRRPLLPFRDPFLAEAMAHE